MAHLDRLIRNIVNRRISLAALQPDSPIVLDMGGGDTRPLNDHILTARQVEMLLFEVLSSGLKEDLRHAGRAEFEYDSPVGPVGVTALRRGGKLSVYLSTARTIDYQDAADERDSANGAQRSGFDLYEVSSEVDDHEPEPSEPSGPSELVEPSELSEAVAPSEPVELVDPMDDFEMSEGDDDFGISIAEESEAVDADDEAWEDELHELDNAVEQRGLGEGSSFVDPSARPAAVDAQMGKAARGAEERAISMQEPGTETPIDRYLRVMEEEDCSDLHMTSNNPPMYRKDGEITLLRNMKSLSPSEVEELLLPIMPDRNYEEFLEIRDTDFAYEIDGVGRFRCNVFMDRLGPGAVFRIIPDEILTAEDLDLSQHLLDLCFLNKGMVLVTGPTGSGKSTTLAALIDYINRKRKSHIITLEDPIEFVHPNKKCLINQREIGVHTMSFKNAIRAALREDPDIVLVGELRDLETIHMAIETAETGHLVFGTLHTNTAPSTVDRLIDQFPTDRQSQIRTMLSESLRAVIAQTLCKKVGGGRVAAMEVLIGTRAVSNLIREGKTHQISSVMETKKGEGMVALNDSLYHLVTDGQITPEEAYYNAVDKTALRKRLERAGYQINLNG